MSASSRLLSCTGAAVALALVLCAGTAAGRPSASVAGSSPVVQSMIVGSAGAILAPARTITAAATTVRVGGRSCAIAAGTPLAVLTAVSRSGGPGFSLRDYGHCGASPTNSGQLFVYSLGGETNRGQSGWEYKVDGTSGDTGAADPSGPSGNGRRLSSGEQLLWFWCAAYAGGCQRTLEVAPSASTVRAGGSLNVTVTARNNEGQAVPVGGAIVTLGSDFASTAANGRATLLLTREAGRFPLSATRNGLVPSFPETIVVR